MNQVPPELRDHFVSSQRRVKFSQWRKACSPKSTGKVVQDQRYYDLFEPPVWTPGRWFRDVWIDLVPTHFAIVIEINSRFEELYDISILWWVWSPV